MNHPVKIEASLACANFSNLERELKLLEECPVDSLHIDMMDGSFVLNFGLDFGIVETIKRISSLPIEFHLMIDKPERYIEKVASYEPEYITIHWESTPNVHRVLQQIQALGIKSGIAINPATPVSVLTYILNIVDVVNVMTVNPGFAGQKLIPGGVNKISRVQELLTKEGFDNIEIQVDGNVSFENIRAMVKAGGNLLVGGSSSLFHKDYNIKQSYEKIKEIIK